ncbi:motility associated factor glycosyltransferase family protein [Campylobacter peloridis]|uniref:Motility associated factor glycosyltransferase family protein n=1 Tax=Campylobacter peloridis TaxID=488546 RepID=A0A5C7DV90_9BACT|nr:motility associated factor glycosyltransferase family protein [Campylobacter peloridis]TXE81300.1 motility associated factor glycosyltransferase family protein [Campylobacter peloridis]
MGGGLIELNFLNTNNNLAIYENPSLELSEKLSLFQDEYLLYPVLYFYGFGNGILYKSLLKNNHLKHIVVFEDDIELLYNIFHFLDFSQELKEQKIIILNTKISDDDLKNLFQTNPFYTFLRIYNLHIHSKYYEIYQENIINLNLRISQIIKSIILSNGTDIKDALQGILQFVFNIPSMIKNPPLKEILISRNNKSKSAIIVSTGPSLSKQLPLLKKYQNYFSIFCVDSAYSILAKEDIKPDYVLMSERAEITANLLKQDYKNIDKDIIFILLALAHPSAIKYLENSNRKYILVPYPSKFVMDLKLYDFCLLTAGSTVALNALELACELNHKNIIFIGQDLAYAKDGSSHVKGYFYEDEELDEIKEFALSYGGNGEVLTHSTWNMFKITIQNFINNKTNFNFYNATEGGARIQGTIEKPFKQCCEELLDKNLSKPFLMPKALNINTQNELLINIYEKIKFILKKCDEFIYEFSEYLEKLIVSLNNIQNIKDFHTLKECIINTMNDLDKFKLKIDFYSNEYFYEIILPFVSQFELNLARIYVLNPKNNDQWLSKNITWIKDHIFLIEILIANIKLLKEEITKNLTPLQNELSIRKLKTI